MTALVSVWELMVRILPWPSKPARSGPDDCDFAKFGSGYVRDSIMTREPLIHVRVVCGPEFEWITIVAQLAFE